MDIDNIATFGNTKVILVRFAIVILNLVAGHLRQEALERSLWNDRLISTANLERLESQCPNDIVV